MPGFFIYIFHLCKVKKASITVTNDLETDQRVHKIAGSLQKAGYEITLIGIIITGKSGLLKRSYNTIRFRRLFTFGPLFYAEYNIRLFFYLMFHKYNVHIACDLDTLLPNYIVSRLCKRQLVYDSHELFTGLPELVNRKRVRNLWLKIEKNILPHLEHAYTVCNSIADYYNEKYGINMKVVKNVPYRKNSAAESRVEKNKTKKIILYQGALNVGRGIEYMIEAMQYIEDAVFMIAGDGYLREELENKVKELGLEKKIRFLGRLAFDKLHEITLQADIGISLEENLGLNYYFALPNKLFDYIQANVPVLVSPLPEIKNVVEKYKIGLLIEKHDSCHIADIIKEMLSDSERITEWKKKLEKAAKELCWEKEEKKLLEIYAEL